MARDPAAVHVRTSRAFSIVEALVAGLVFVVVFVAMMQLFTGTGVKQMTAIRDYAAVMAVAESFLAQQAEDLDGGSVAPMNDVDVTAQIRAAPHLAASVKVIESLAAHMTVRPESIPGLYTIVLTVEWTDGPQREFTLATHKMLRS